MEKDKNSVLIKIHDFECSIDEISNLLSVSPSEAWLKGDQIPGRQGNIKRKHSTWQLRANVPSHVSIEEHLEYLLPIIKKNQETFRNLCDKYDCELTFVRYLYQEFNPGFTFDKEFLRLVASIGFNIDIDIYMLPKEKGK